MRYVKLIMALFLCFINLSTVSAVCNNSLIKELGEKASYIKVNYEIIDNSESKEIKIGKEKNTYIVPNFKYDISLYNLDKKLSAKIENTITKESKIITNDMTKNGIYTFQSYDFSNVKNYLIEIMASDNDCAGKKIRTIRLTVPKYNPYSEYTFCQNSSLLYCQKFVKQDLNIKNTDDFLKKIKVNNELNNPKKENENETVSDILMKNWKLYLCVFVLIVIISILFIVIKKKRDKKAGWRL